jgi:hypothetical protein
MVTHFAILLDTEVKNHQTTYILYTNALQSSESWKLAHAEAMGELDVAYITTSTYQMENEKLRMENRRLNCVIAELTMKNDNPVRI